MRMVVIGLGYLGATHAACMAELGHEVLGVEVDDRRRGMLANGTVPFYEPGLAELLTTHLASGRLTISGSYEQAVEWADVFFIAVGTPQKKGEYSADLSYIDDAIYSLASQLLRDALIIGKSTVPVGTCSRLAQMADNVSKEGLTVEVAWNPEFLREGHAIDDTLRPDRLVLGADPAGCAESVVREIYSQTISDGTPFLTMDTASAEMVKVAANSFLATKISFINAIAEVCEVAGADVTAVADAIGYDERIGRRFLNAGLGFGGGCLPKDIRAFMARAGELGAAEALAFLREVDNVNMRRRNRMVDVTRKACGGSVLGTRIAVLGAAFKPGSDDVRDSPALNVAGQLQLQGGSVVVYDPKARASSEILFPTLEYADGVPEACEDADIVLVLTEWDEFRNLQPEKLASSVRGKIVVDGRNCLEAEAWQRAGWKFLR